MANSRSNFIKGVYRKNSRPFAGFRETGHSLTVDVEEYDIEYNQIKFNRKDMPYFKLALVDRHLEELGY